MYIYKVTDTTSGKFYFSISNQHWKHFNPRTDVDPQNQFDYKKYNGKSYTIACVKQLIYRNTDINYLYEVSKKLISKFKNNEKFIGFLPEFEEPYDYDDYVNKTGRYAPSTFQRGDNHKIRRRGRPVDVKFDFDTSIFELNWDEFVYPSDNND